MSTTIKAFHGGERDGARWFSTSRDHAGYFGDVHEATIEAPESSTEKIEDLEEAGIFVAGGGFEQDVAFYDYMDENGVEVLLVPSEHTRGTHDIILSDYAARKYLSWD